MTKRPARWTAVLLISAAGAGFGVHGCGTELSIDSTLGDVLDVLTSGDLASAFAAFASADDGAGGLSDDQIAAIEGLQGRFDAGMLNGPAFEEGVESVMGDRMGGMALGGFGLGGPPFAARGFGRLNHLLALTADQQAQARTIFTEMHANIHALRDAAKDDIRAELTDEQLAILDDLRPGEQDETADSDDAAARHNGHRRGGPGSFASRFSALLDLTDAQQASIDAIRAALREAVRAEHEAARAAFRLILTDEQLAALDAFELSHGHHHDQDDENDQDDQDDQNDQGEHDDQNDADEDVDA